MKAIEQVWPVEAPAPPGLVIGALKPYQKQSLAFMLALERAPDGSETAMGRTMVTGGLQGPQHAKYVPAPRGGWLASEVGMGKTVVTIALVLANPLSLAKSAAAAIAGDGRGGAGGASASSKWPCASCTFANAPGADTCGMCGTTRSGVASQNPGWGAPPPPAAKKATKEDCWKTTVVVCPNTIVGQWYDELRKYAPSLNVAVWHSGFSRNNGGAKHLSMHELEDLDVLVTTPGCMKNFLPGGMRRKMWRIVIDGMRQTCPSHHFLISRWPPTLLTLPALFSLFLAPPRVPRETHRGLLHTLSQLQSLGSDGHAHDLRQE